MPAEAVLMKVKEELSDRFSALSRKDENLIYCLGALIRASSPADGHAVVTEDTVAALGRIDASLQDYVNLLQNHGLLLRTGQGLVITDVVRDILKDRLSGIYIGGYSVDSLAKARQALEDILAEPTLVKIWDPWISDRTLDRVEEYSRREAEIRILGSVFQDPYSDTDTARLKADLKKIADAKGLRITIRMIRYL
jgi:hypothetical protein